MTTRRVVRGLPFVSIQARRSMSNAGQLRSEADAVWACRSRRSLGRPRLNAGALNLRRARIRFFRPNDLEALRNKMT